MTDLQTERTGNVTVDLISKEWVHYHYENGAEAFAHHQWFPNVKIGQIWEITVTPFRIKSCTLIKDVQNGST